MSLFVINKLGYISLFTAVVYLINSIKGRIWCISLEITHKLNSIVVIADEGYGKVMGFTELAVFDGLTLEHKGC